MSHGPHGLTIVGFEGCSYVPVGGYQDIYLDVGLVLMLLLCLM